MLKVFYVGRVKVGRGLLEGSLVSCRGPPRDLGWDLRLLPRLIKVRFLVKF